MRKLSKSFVIITANKTDADKLKDAGYRAFVADTTSESDLAEFVIGRSKGVVIDLGDPSLTVYTFLIVNNLAKNVKTFVIAQNDDVERHLSELGRVPNEFIINPNKIVAKDIMVKI
jgi:TrkA-N domain.